MPEPTLLENSASPITAPRPLAAPLPPLRVLLIEAHPLARHSLGVVLAQGPYRLQAVDLAASCTAALETLAPPPAPGPDLFLLSWPLAAPEGLSNALYLLHLYPQAKTLLLADDVTDPALTQLLAGGAVGCLPKHTDPCALPAILRSLQQGALILPRTHPITTYRPTAAHPTPRFTRRELDVLLGVGRGQPNNQIAHQLGLSPATVRTHVSRLLGKLGLTNRTQLALYALRQPHTA